LTGEERLYVREVYIRMRTSEARRSSRLPRFYVPPVTEAAIFKEETPTGVDKAIEVDTVTGRASRIAGELAVSYTHSDAADEVSVV
jgi:hypothetical protein